MSARAWASGLGLTLFAACSGPSIDGTPWSCVSQADCLDGFICSTSAGVCVTAEADAPGVTPTKITVAMTAPLSTGAVLLGQRMRGGIEAYFFYVNGSGGVDGRQLELVTIDDGGDGNAALADIDARIGAGSLLGFVGSVGTDANEVIVPRLVSSRTLVFGVRSGSASLRRDPPDRYVFNVRPGTVEEARRAIGYVTSVRDPRVAGKNVATFTPSGNDDQPTAAARTTIDAVTKALRDQLQVMSSDVLSVSHRRGSVAVDEAVGATLHWLGSGDREPNANGQILAAVVLDTTARASAAYVKALLDEFHRIKRGTSPGTEFGLTAAEVNELLNVGDILFVALSTVDGDELSSELSALGTVQTLAGDRSYCLDVLTTQVVPAYDAGATGTIEFRDHLRAHDAAAAPSYVGLEGYLTARLFVEGLRRHGPLLSVEPLIDSFDQLSEVDLGVGATFGFSPSQRSASNKVWGTALDSACRHVATDLGEPTPIPTDPNPPDGCVGGVCILTGTLTRDTTLTADRRWLLRGAVFIGDGTNRTVLTIEPGTTIIGEQSTTGLLVIRRGSQIQASGTREAPIVFTSERPIGMRERGDWGGLILNGRAPINRCGMQPCEAFGEGGTGFFGGADEADNSGTLRYVRIEFAGRLLSPENELNGLALQGVGSGTSIDYVQIHYGQDDGVEFFGGTVNVKHLLITGADDDCFDWTDGWRGKAQFIVAQQRPGNGDNGIEADNYAMDNAATPRSKPTISNVTLIGTPMSDNSDDGMLLRAGTAAHISNAIVMGWNASCANIDDAETFSNALVGTSTLSGELLVSRSIFSCMTTFATNAADPIDLATFFMTLNQGNVVADPMLTSPYDYVSPNFTPRVGSPALGNGQIPADAFFEDVDFIGGVGPGNDWTLGWTTNASD